MTLISNQREILCVDPVYHALTGAGLEADIHRSHIVAQPSGEVSFGGICYVLLKAGRRPVVVTLQKDGSIHLSGAYVNTIAMELGLTPVQVSK